MSAPSGIETPPKTFTQEDIDRAAARARDEEKNKLYPDIERHKTDAKKLEDEKKALQAEIDGLKSTSTEAQKLTGEIERLKTEQAAVESRYQKAMGDILDAQKREFDERERRQEVSALRRELIASAGGKCIPSLVAGNTEEEVRRSFERSKEEYKRIHDEVAAVAKAEYEERLKGALPGPVVTAPADSSSDIQGGLQEWRTLSPKEWEAKKSEITQAAYKKVGLRMKAE